MVATGTGADFADTDVASAGLQSLIGADEDQVSGTRNLDGTVRERNASLVGTAPLYAKDRARQGGGPSHDPGAHPGDCNRYNPEGTTFQAPKRLGRRPEVQSIATSSMAKVRS